MKIFTKINDRLILRSVLLGSVVVFALVGCKRIVTPVDTPDVPVDEDELTVIASRPLPIDQQNFAPSRAEVSIDEFTAGSEIGLFAQLKSESDKGSESVLKSNAHYKYDQPIWQPATRDDKLMYHETSPIYVFGYYPHPSMVGSSTSVVSGSSNVNFTLRKDQSDQEATKVSDLLWVGAKNLGNGYLRQRLPINLLFQHKLCKVSFYVKLIDSKPDASALPQTRAYLRSVTAAGPQITTKAILKALSGSLLPTYNPGHFDSVRWESPTGVELLIDAPAVHIVDMLLVPFVAVDMENWFRYMLYYPEADFVQNFVARIPKYDPAATGTSAGKLCFESNKHNKVTITIDVSSIYMTIEADIEPWGVGGSAELPAEPE